MKINYFFYLLLCLTVMNSCSNDDDDPAPTPTPSDIGRFDDKPFAWDFTNQGSDDIYITGVNAYLGGVYPIESVKSGLFDKESTQPRNPIDLVFDFTHPYFDKVGLETGAIGYISAYKRAIASSEFSDYLQLNKIITDYMITEYYTFDDLSKVFKEDISLFDRYKIKIEENREQKVIKSRSVSKIINIHFSTYMDFPVGGIFQDSSLNNGSDLYVSSISYGKVAYLVVESEYPYADIKSVVYKLISNGFTADIMTKEQNDVLAKSSFTICISDDSHTDNSYFKSDLASLEDFFTKKYTKESPGYPVSVQLRTLENKKYN